MMIVIIVFIDSGWIRTHNWNIFNLISCIIFTIKALYTMYIFVTYLSISIVLLLVYREMKKKKKTISWSYTSNLFLSGLDAHTFIYINIYLDYNKIRDVLLFISFQFLFCFWCRFSFIKIIFVRCKWDRMYRLNTMIIFCFFFFFSLDICNSVVHFIQCVEMYVDSWCWREYNIVCMKEWL